MDQYGHMCLGEEPLTDPYGHLNWTIGNTDDFYCFDYCILPDGRVILHSVINSETGSFIQDGEYWIGAANEAEDKAWSMLDDAWGWIMDNTIKRTHGIQSQQNFVRALLNSIKQFDIYKFPA